MQGTVPEALSLISYSSCYCECSAVLRSETYMAVRITSEDGQLQHVLVALKFNTGLALPLRMYKDVR